MRKSDVLKFHNVFHINTRGALDIWSNNLCSEKCRLWKCLMLSVQSQWIVLTILLLLMCQEKSGEIASHHQSNWKYKKY